MSAEFPRRQPTHTTGSGVQSFSNTGAIPLDRTQNYNVVYDEGSKPQQAEFLYSGGPSPVVVDTVQELLASNEPMNFAIDLGCGPGRQARYLSEYYGHVLGIDNSSKALEDAIAANEKGNISLALFNMTDFIGIDKVLPETADLLVAISVVNHGTHKDILTTYAQAWHALRPGGKMVLTMISTSNPAYLSDKKIRVEGFEDEETYYPRTGIDGHIPHHFSTMREVAMDLVKTGFKIEKLYEDPTNAAIGGISGGHIITVCEKIITQSSKRNQIYI